MSKQIVAVVGSSFGDEGKAKIVDCLSKDFDYVVRYQGGDNAGHSIYLDEKSKYVFQLIPTGILNSKAVISHGVVLNPEQLLKEITNVSNLVSVPGRLFISNNVHIIFDWAISLDKLIEQIRGGDKIGTTNKGIGPSYAFKALRTGVRACDLLDEVKLRKCIDFNLKILNPLFKEYGYDLFDTETCLKKYLELGQKIKPYLTDVTGFLQKEIREGKKVLFEGSQGLMLDLDMGTYPFVTSSNIVGALVSGTGLSPATFKDGLLGVVKAYSSRVGFGEFPTEIEDENLADYIRKTGNEYGSVTSRPRRIGWLDLVFLKYSVDFSGITDVAITLVDVLNGLPEVKVCVDYLDGDGNSVSWSAIRKNTSIKPVYKTFKGWKDNYSNIKKYEDFSAEFKEFVDFVVKFLGVRTKIISFGKTREAILILD
ncbi:adenylosuccinate synthase [Candidatus Mycoplasma haematohominis]|uniref:Adenylosuccinate synthetase n=1 Tax=Candidatus Mycoplasma haematohominis TaxID=1494318 RepID=A0A478FPX2_9MOLU|nr:adenylosuccinate synthase [Candidatus Mycoplasma haemohominis]GCE63302.1 adenylosuccinate synthetase [Candidatus Mycoplasma haemohominis]